MTMSERENPPRELVKKLEQLGPEQVVDGYELCPQCDGLSPGIHMDGETIMHCSTCHDKHAVTGRGRPLAGGGAKSICGPARIRRRARISVRRCPKSE